MRRLVVLGLCTAACTNGARTPGAPLQQRGSEWLVRSGAVSLQASAREAEEALAVLAASDTSERARAWARLTATVPYRRLHEREASLGRAFTDSSFLAYLAADSVVQQQAAFARTLQLWRSADIAGAARRAAAYLPVGTPVAAELYFVIKPRRNTFVFELQTRPTIFVTVDPELTVAQFQAEYAHELHHIGYARACAKGRSRAVSGTLAELRGWMGSFGEGLAMLAAAGTPDIDPNAIQDSTRRAVWNRDYGNVGADMARLEHFFSQILRGTLHGDSATHIGMSFFGPVQGPWYTVGYLMASTIERTGGRAALLAVICDPVRLLQRYQAIALTRATGALPRWNPAFVTQLDSLVAAASRTGERGPREPR